MPNNTRIHEVGFGEIHHHGKLQSEYGSPVVVRSKNLSSRIKGLILSIVPISHKDPIREFGLLPYTWAVRLLSHLSTTLFSV